MSERSEPWEVAGTASGGGRPIGLRDAIYFLQASLLPVCVGIAAGIALGLLAQKNMTPVFETDGKFIVDQIPFAQSAGSTDAQTERELVQTLIFSVTSREMKVAVIGKLGIQPGQIAFVDMDRALRLSGAEPQANVSVRSVRNSRVGSIEASSQDAEFAAQVVNAMLDELSLYNSLGGLIRNIQLDLDLAKLKADSLTAQLVDVGAERIKLEQQNAALDAYLRQGLPAASFPTFSQDATLNNLRTQLVLVKAEYDRTASTSTRGERLLGRRAEMQGLQTQLDSVAKDLVAGLRSQFEISRTREKDIQNLLASTTALIDRHRQEIAKMTQSFGDPARMRKVIEEYGKASQTSSNVFVVLDRAAPKTKPVRPKLWLNLFLGVVLGGGIGMGFAILRTALDTRLRYAAQIERLTRCKCLAVLPARPPGAKRAGSTTLPSQAAYSVGLAYVRSLVLRSAEESGNIVGFSPARAEKSTALVVADLALLIAREGKRVLLVDLDLARPRIAGYLGAKVDRGLDGFFASQGPIDDFLSPTSEPNLSLLSAGTRADGFDVHELLAQRPLHDALTAIRCNWDFIILNAPGLIDNWALLLALPPGSPLFLTASFNRTQVTDVVTSLYHTKGPGWSVQGLVLLNSPRRSGRKSKRRLPPDIAHPQAVG